MKKHNKIYLNVFFIMLLILIAFFMIFFSFFDPYEDYSKHWDVKVIDYDALDFLRFFWGITFVVNILGVFISKKYSKWFFAIFIVYALISFFQFIKLI